jgi:soluble P-type ATPase
MLQIPRMISNRIKISNSFKSREFTNDIYRRTIAESMLPAIGEHVSFFNQDRRSVVKVTIPGRAPFNIQHIVFDYNGTLAVDGIIDPAVKASLYDLAQKIDITVLSADTFGTVTQALDLFPGAIRILTPGNEREAKKTFVTELGAGSVMAVGNGANDEWMLETAQLSICVLGREGAAFAAMAASDIIVSGPESIFELLAHPQRITATLRT